MGVAPCEEFLFAPLVSGRFTELDCVERREPRASDDHVSRRQQQGLCESLPCGMRPNQELVALPDMQEFAAGSMSLVPGGKLWWPSLVE